MMLLPAITVWVTLLSAEIQPVPLREPVTSHTGQFIVHGQSSAEPAPIQTTPNGPVYVWLEPQILAVMAERIKAAFYAEIGHRPAYKDKAFLWLVPTRRRENPINIVSTAYSDGWRYQAQFPAIADQDNVIRGLLQLVMMEFTNRGYNRAGEIPTWLFEGMHQEILNSALPTYLVSRRVVMAEVRGFNRVETSRSIIKSNPRMSFHDLSFPRVNFNDPAQAAVFRANAHIALHELLKLNHGPALIAAFLRRTPEKLNWQTAFLEVFSRHFGRMLDVEKWWALTCVDIQGRDVQDLWPLNLSVQKLQSILTSSVEFRAQTNSLPVRREIALGDVLALESTALQKQVLERKSMELQFLAQQLAPEISAIALAYRAAMIEYLTDLQNLRVQPGLKQDPEQLRNLAVSSATAKLKEIDKHLLATLSAKK